MQMVHVMSIYERRGGPLVSEEDSSRRHFLKSVAGGLSLGLCELGDKRQHISAVTNMNNQSMAQQGVTPNRSQMNKRPAYIALPGLNVCSLLANIPSIMDTSEEDVPRKPVILMDTYDYNWLQALALERNDEPFFQNFAMAYGHLHRRGVIQLINYSDFYSKSIQQTNLQRNQSLIDSISTEDHQDAAVGATEGWKNYVRGSYLDSFRTRLGQDQKTNRKTRRNEKNKKEKLSRGLGAPIEWNNRILDKHIAALKICRYADEAFAHLNVKGVIGEKESGVISKFLDVAPPTVNTRYIKELNPNHHIIELEDIDSTRKLFNTIGEMATEKAEVQHNDWIILGPTLAFPQYENLFDLDALEDEREDGDDVHPEEVDRVVSTLENRVENDPDMTYTLEYIGENGIMPFAPNPAQRQGITKIGDYATTLAQFSDELRDLDDVSQTAALIGTSIVSDPSPHTTLNDVYQQGEDLINQFSPHQFTANQIQTSFRRTDNYDTTLEWYEDENQPR